MNIMTAARFLAIGGIALSNVSFTADADPQFSCGTDGVLWTVNGRGEALRAYIYYVNNSTDWFACSVTCNFQKYASAESALPLNCTSIITPSIPLYKNTVGYNIMCLSTVGNANYGITNLPEPKHTCEKVPSPIPNGQTLAYRGRLPRSRPAAMPTTPGLTSFFSSLFH